MRIAMPVWRQRISPLLDVAGRFMFVEVENGKAATKWEEEISSNSPWARASRLISSGVDVVMCGALSEALLDMLSGEGVTVVSFLAGDAEEILLKYLAGEMVVTRYAMPGCKRRRQFRGGGGPDCRLPKKGRRNEGCSRVQRTGNEQRSGSQIRPSGVFR